MTSPLPIIIQQKLSVTRGIQPEMTVDNRMRYVAHSEPPRVLKTLHVRSEEAGDEIFAIVDYGGGGEIDGVTLISSDARLAEIFMSATSGSISKFNGDTYKVLHVNGGLNPALDVVKSLSNNILCILSGFRDEIYADIAEREKSFEKSLENTFTIMNNWITDTECCRQYIIRIRNLATHEDYPILISDANALFQQYTEIESFSLQRELKSRFGSIAERYYCHARYFDSLIEQAHSLCEGSTLSIWNASDVDLIPRLLMKVQEECQETELQGRTEYTHYLNDQTELQANFEVALNDMIQYHVESDLQIFEHRVSELRIHLDSLDRRISRIEYEVSLKRDARHGNSSLHNSQTHTQPSKPSSQISRGNSDNAIVGAGIGAVTGGLLFSWAFGAIVVGAVIGFLVGSDEQAKSK